MGTSIDSIVATYQSLSRGNFAMLDNLKLGYGGTKAEMERLIADAAKLDSSVKANDMSFGNMVKAIHAVQEELGVAGATALEASTTIEGSANAMKAAWENLKVGFANENADMGALIQQFFDSAVTYAQNAIPRFVQAAQGVGKALVVAINDLLPQIIEKVAEGTPQMLQQGGELVGGLVTGLIKAIPKIIAATPQLIMALLEGIGAFIGEVLLAGANLVGEFVSGINSRIASVGGSGREVAAMFKQSIMDIVNAAKNWGRDLIQNFVGGIKSKLGDLKNAASNMAQTVRGYIHFTKPDVGPLSDFDTYAPDMIDLFAKGIDANAYKIGDSFNKGLDFGVQTVPFAQSSYGTATAATLNATAGAGTVDAPVNGSIKLVTPEGRTLMEWLFDDLVSIAKSRGTPIMA